MCKVVRAPRNNETRAQDVRTQIHSRRSTPLSAQFLGGAHGWPKPSKRVFTGLLSSCQAINPCLTMQTKSEAFFQHSFVARLLRGRRWWRRWRLFDIYHYLQRSAWNKTSCRGMMRSKLTVVPHPHPICVDTAIPYSILYDIYIYIIHVLCSIIWVCDMCIYIHIYIYMCYVSRITHVYVYVNLYI